MKICHVCKAECDDDALLCSVCGAELIGDIKQDTEEETEDIELKNPVLAVSVEDVVTEEIFKDILTENGIPFACEEGGMKVVFGGGFNASEIYVEDYDLERAQQLYSELMNSETEFDYEQEDETDEIGE